MELNEILRIATANQASDIHLRVGIPPMLRIHGEFVAVEHLGRLTPEQTKALATELLTPPQRELFQLRNELDIGYAIKGLGRFRVNVFRQRATVAITMRVIPRKIGSFEDLNLPTLIEKIADVRRGLVLVTGATGSGKSTTLAAMLNHINRTRSEHILTIEDPIEYYHRDRRSIITQREVGVDTKSFATALRSALRQDPDVILVGEMRDLDTIEIALSAAATGHLVLSTVHTNNASETLARIVGFFPPHHQKAIRKQLSNVLHAVVSQRLIPRSEGEGRLPAVEVLLNTERIRELIASEERTNEVGDAIREGHAAYGMQSFDQSIFQHYKAGLINYEDALRFASNPDDLALRCSGVTSGSEKW